MSARECKQYHCRVKVASEPQRYRLAGMELVRMDSPIFDIARFLKGTTSSAAAFTFVVCFTLPHQGSILHLVLLFATDARPVKLCDLEAAASPFDRCMARHDHHLFPLLFNIPIISCRLLFSG
jgi:hypothetical protein